MYTSISRQKYMAIGKQTRLNPLDAKCAIYGTYRLDAKFI